MQFGMASWAIVDATSTPVWDISKSGNYPLEVTAVAAAEAPAAAAASTPSTMPATGGAFAGLILAGLAGLTATGVGLKLRK